MGYNGNQLYNMFKYISALLMYYTTGIANVWPFFLIKFIILTQLVMKIYFSLPNCIKHA